MSKISEEVILEFIKAYYNSFSYDQDSLQKFYANDSFIYRPFLETKLAKPFEEMKEKIPIEITKGTHVSITSHSAIPLNDERVNLTVNGTIINDEEKKCFVQNFTLQFREISIWIVADSLNIQNIDIEDQNKDLVNVRKPKWHK